MSLQAEDEGRALMWLAALPRTEKANYNQVIIRSVPGKYGAVGGAPYFHVSIKYPGLKYRVRATGNTLLSAVQHAQAMFSIKGIDLPFIPGR